MSAYPKYVPTPYALESYTPVPECGCWIWTGAWNQAGYGRVGPRRYPGLPRKESPLAHRMFYEHHIGPIPAGMLVMHKCDTPLCVNPAHLTIGTNADNAADKIAKGRARTCRADPLPQDMIDLILSGVMSRRLLWDRHKISPDRIKRVRRKYRKAIAHPAQAGGGAE